MSELNIEREGEDRGADFKRNLDALNEFRKRQRYGAIITAVSTEANHQDEYVVDIYNTLQIFDGLGNIIATPIMKDITAFSFGSGAPVYPKGRMVQVNYFNDIALILPPQVPEDFGFGKVLMIVDNAGSWWGDYPRFNSKYSLLAPDEFDEVTNGQ